MKLSDKELETLRELPPKKLLEEVFGLFGERAAIGTSFQKTGTVIIDIASKVLDDFRVFFIDTLRHPDETYKFIKTVEEKYSIEVEKYRPDVEELTELLREQGRYGHLFSVDERKNCCQIRKINPARKMEANLEAAISGLRADQSGFRNKNLSKVYYKKRVGQQSLLKVNPLYDWTEADLDSYIEEHKLEIHPLYDYVSECGEKYRVIGCETCHVPVQADRPARAGKFPWETSEKECGLHYKDGGGI